MRRPALGTGCSDDVLRGQAENGILALVVMFERDAKVCESIFRIAQSFTETRFVGLGSFRRCPQSLHIPDASMYHHQTAPDTKISAVPSQSRGRLRCRCLQKPR